MQTKKIKYLVFVLLLSVNYIKADDKLFSYLNGEDRKKCLNMYKKGELKFDSHLLIFYKPSYSPLTGHKKEYYCNKKKQTTNAFSSLVNKLDKLDNFDNDNNKKNSLSEDEEKDQVSLSDDSGLGAFGRGALNLLVPGAALLDSSPKANNFSGNSGGDQIPKNDEGDNIGLLSATTSILGIGGSSNKSSVSMKIALLNLNKAQAYFLEALDEDELALATRNYVKKLESGSVIGEDDLEKVLVQSKENQEIINNKMLEVEKLSLEAKETFSKGIAPYSVGLLSLVQSGFSVSDTISSFSGGIGGIFSAIGLAVTAKDALTAIPLFFDSSGKIIDFASQNDINTDELDDAKNELGV